MQRGGHTLNRVAVMNDRRYKSYVEVSRLLRSDLFDPGERAVLLDAAEGLLLMRSPDSPELGELEANVDATLEGLIADGRVKAKTAAQLRERIGACGPGSATAMAA
jgi:hypothetical protein